MNALDFRQFRKAQSVPEHSPDDYGLLTEDELALRFVAALMLIDEVP